ncbi:class I SAM-dependent methyltransferase [Demetria terragena]|uniref:methyltransferase domain-containing protein n=1 Tax=Demetria terragena TaxID=63959 RepID=UPI00037747E2|nr:class I SAM-dependent methyltransferase [Demetria terragena]
MPDDSSAAIRPTRWEQAGVGRRGYGEKFAGLIRAGKDVEGEARLADALAPRAATILDAGSGMGRVGAALQRRGHRVIGVDLDEELVAQSRSTYPELPVVQARLDHLAPEVLHERGFPTAYDLIVVVGNVMILLADGTEQLVLRRLRALLVPGGRILVGFHTNAWPANSRTYHPDDFVADARAAGLDLEQRFASYDLLPYVAGTDYVVTVLRRSGESASPSGATEAV